MVEAQPSEMIQSRSSDKVVNLTDCDRSRCVNRELQMVLLSIIFYQAVEHSSVRSLYLLCNLLFLPHFTVCCSRETFVLITTCEYSPISIHSLELRTVMVPLSLLYLSLLSDCIEVLCQAVRLCLKGNI